MNISNDIRARIEAAAVALVSEGVDNPTNEQVRQKLGSGSLSHISPVMREWRQKRREQAAVVVQPVPDALQRQAIDLTARLWQQAREQADADTAAVREQADADIAQADEQRDEALDEVRRLEAELAVFRNVADERDRLRDQLDELKTVLSVTRADYAALKATAEATDRQLDDTRAELKAAREDNKALQGELLQLARDAGKKTEPAHTKTDKE
ncbi:DNA-binding protein [Klebsiella pneumoniae]|uniref:DNA-binding protein n=1 Tax=Klebsiella pneumoniae TaxID=573 RepID=UPI0013304D4D|nr:DNA-binding protein [Klebsiella pneumoniae]